MLKPHSFVTAAVLATMFALPLHSQDAPTADTVVATVNKTDITVGHMIAARARLPEQYQQLPADVLFKGILDQLVQQTALSDAFEGELPRRVTILLENERRSLVAGEMIEQVMAEPVSDEALQAAYADQYTGVDPEIEYNAAHILVETEDEAKAIKEEIEGGADFAAVAREKSTGPSGPSGGALGWFGKGMMVPSFETAVIAMQDGEISDPIETQFGWHVIQRIETRKAEVPPMDDVREELELQIKQTDVQTAITSITEKADVNQDGAEGIDPAVLSQTDLLE